MQQACSTAAPRVTWIFSRMDSAFSHRPRGVCRSNAHITAIHSHLFIFYPFGYADSAGVGIAYHTAAMRYRITEAVNYFNKCQSSPMTLVMLIPKNRCLPSPVQDRWTFQNMPVEAGIFLQGQEDCIKYSSVFQILACNCSAFSTRISRTTPTSQPEAHRAAHRCPPKRSHFHELAPTTLLIWNDRFQVDKIRFLFCFSTFS